MTSRVDFSNLNVHKMLQGFVSLVLDKTVLVDAAAKESESRKLRNLIDDQSRHLPSQTEFSVLMSKLTESGYELLNQTDLFYKIAGLFVLDCLLDINEELVTDRRISIANTLRKIFENGDKTTNSIESGCVILRLSAQLIGHLARIASTVEIEYLQTTYYPIAMRLVGTTVTKGLLGNNNTDKEDFLKYAGCVLLTELANHSPAIIFSRRKQVFASVWEVVSDKSSVVREAGAEALQSCLLLISQRESMGDWLAVALDRVDSGFSSNTPERIIGSLLILDIVIGGIVVSIPELQTIMKTLNRAFHTTINSVLQFRSHKDEMVRKKVINITPQLAAAFSATFTVPNQYTTPFNFLHFTIHYLVDLIRLKQQVRGDQERQIAYISLGKLVTIMSGALRVSKDGTVNPAITDILSTIKQGFTRDEFFCVQALDCLGLMVKAISSSRSFVDRDLIECMFRGGVTADLIANLTIITKHVPSVQSLVQSLLLTHIKSILKSYDVSLVQGSRTIKSVANLFASVAGDSTSATAARGVRSNSLQRPLMTSSLSIGLSSADDSSVGKRSDRHFRSPFGIRDKVSALTFPSTTTDARSLAIEKDKGDDSGSQIILALQILASPEFFTRDTSTIKRNRFRNRTRLGSADKSSVSDIRSDQFTVLLRVVRDVVLRYLDDYSHEVRAAAVTTCVRVLDTAVWKLDTDSEEYAIFMQILNRVLLLGVGDDLKSIRLTAFQSLPASLDKSIAESENVFCVFQACNDESTAVRVAAMEVISRVAHYDTLRIMPTVRVMLHRLMSQVQNFTEKESNTLTNYTIYHESKSIMLRLQSVQSLQALLRGAKILIAPYVGQILEVLVPLLYDTSTFIARSALSSIAELSIASPEVVSKTLDDIFPHLIRSLKDEKSVDNQETAVEALGKLVSSLALVTEDPYAVYEGLFEGLVGIIQSDETYVELQLKAIKTAGLLGVVEPNVFNTQMMAYRRGFGGDNDEEDEGAVDIFITKYTDGKLVNSATRKFSGAQAQIDNKKNFSKTKNSQETPEQFVQRDIEVMLIEREQKEDMALEQKQYLEQYLAETKEKKITHTERFYLNVVMRNLVEILTDPTLPASHQSASQICIRILRIVGPQGHFLVPDFLQAIITRLHNLESGNNLITALLDHVMTIIHIMGRMMRPHIRELTNLIMEFFPTRGYVCMDMLESLALKLPFPYFNLVLRDLLPLILQKLQNEPQEFLKAMTEKETTAQGSQSYSSTLFGAAATTSTNVSSANNLPQTSIILQSFVNMQSVFSDHHKKVIIPSILHLLDYQHKSISDMRKKALGVVLTLVDDETLLEYANQIILPLMRILNDIANISNTPILQKSAITALSFLLCRLGTSYTPFIIPVRRNLNNFSMSVKSNNVVHPQLEEYNNFVNRLLEHRPLPMEPVDAADMHVAVDERIRNRIKNVRIIPEKHAPPVLASLEQAWALAGRNNATDLGDWMNRLANELIRQSPSPYIRACAALAKTHKPLAEELFTVCFVCIWDELFLADTNDVVDDNSLIQSLESALRSPQISVNTMNSLLTLAEFMDMQDKRLPLDITLLARCAEKANMYAKTLRYRELQFNSTNVDPDGECIEALISVNNQMGRPDRAFGVLDYLSMEYSDIVVEPSWLEKLMKWGDAKQSYMAISNGWREKYPEESLIKHPDWLNNEMGVLRCSHALGEFTFLLNAATKLEGFFKTADMTQPGLDAAAAAVQRLGAHSAWMLGMWDEMDTFLASDFEKVSDDQQQLVDVTNSVSFYRSVLAIHKEDFNSAQDFIDATRAELAGTISSLLSESYIRAYPAMVTMQILSELEEIVEYKKELSAINASLQKEEESIKNMLEEYGHDRTRSNSLQPETPFTPSSKLIRRSFSGSVNLLSNNNASASANNVDKRYSGAGMDSFDTDIRLREITKRKQDLIRKWNSRLKWAPKEVAVYSQLLAVHTLVAEPSENLDAWIQLVELCRKEDMFVLCENILRRLGAKLPVKDSGASIIEIGVASTQLSENDGLGSPGGKEFGSSNESEHNSGTGIQPRALNFGGAQSPETPAAKNISSLSTNNRTSISSNDSFDTPTNPVVEFAMLKYLWHSGQQEKALEYLSAFIKRQESDPLIARITAEARSKRAGNVTISIRQLVKDALAEGSIDRHIDVLGESADVGELSSSLSMLSLDAPASGPKQDKSWLDAVNFHVKVLLKRAEWMRELSSTAEERADMLNTVLQARNIAECRHSVWHAWAVTNYDQLQRLNEAKINPTIEEATSAAGVKNKEEKGKPFRERAESLLTAPVPTANGSITSLSNMQHESQGRSPEKRRLSKNKDSEKELISAPLLSKHRYSHHLASIGVSANSVGLAKLGVTEMKKSAVSQPQEAESDTKQADEELRYVTEAIKGFVRSIILVHGKPETYVLEDTLRLLTLWFTYGKKKEVHAITGVEIESVAPDCWLGVLPQLIARMYVTSPEIYLVLQSLLTKLAHKHPQALVCPISVARNTQNNQQKLIATHVLKELRKNQSQLVEEATMLSRELMRAAASPHEMWKEQLEQAYGQYMGRDADGVAISGYATRVATMLQTLTNIHDAMVDSYGDVTVNDEIGFAEGSGKIGFTTLRDISFRQSFGRQLAAAKDRLDQFRETGLLATLHELWEIYFDVIRCTEVSINAQKKVQLSHVSRELTSSRNLMLCVPGTYIPNSECVSIAKFVNTLNIIMSKQRPRRLAILGSNGKTYDFLLKGKEDLRQDERVMQLFGLINVCLEKARTQGLNIIRYSVLPLSNNSGLIGWVQNCDTFASLLSAYRAERNIPMTLEPMMLRAKLGGGNHIRKYDRLPLLQKVELFQSILDETRGKDLDTMLWLKSKTADAWVERRDNFTRTMAVMSIVGYILGLGDRHMANIMLHRHSGCVVHIDFGDSFEVNKTRALYPETIPFRLTRMLSNCMGQAGMAGTFKVTAYKVMRVLHDNRDSVLAMLEAFVYDPMISWRVLASNAAGAAPGEQISNVGNQTQKNEDHPMVNEMISGTLNVATNMLNTTMDQIVARNDDFDDHLITEQLNANEANYDNDTTAEQVLAKQSMTFKVKPIAPTLQAMNPADHAIKMSLRMATYQAPAHAHILASIAPTAAAGMTNNAGGVILNPVAIAAASLKIKSTTSSAPDARPGSGMVNDLEAPITEKLNARALDIINRIHSKLTGYDFWDDRDEVYLTVEQQVDRLIQEATSHENLCCLYSGWQPWW